MCRHLPHHGRQRLARELSERHPHAVAPGDKFFSRRRGEDFEFQVKMREGVLHQTGDKFPFRLERRMTKKIVRTRLIPALLSV